MSKAFLIIVLAFSYLAVEAKSKSTNSDLNNLYRQGQREFQRQNYKAALPLLERYLETSKGKDYKRERLFWVIDQVGRIHLRVNRNPDAAIRFFEKTINDDRLTEAEEDDIGSWLSAAKDWKKLGKMPPKTKSEKELFRLGKKFYQLGNTSKGFASDDAGNAYFSIAQAYLVPLVVNFDSSKHIGEALFMIGDIKRNLRSDPEYWNDNYYLKETIRRNPNSNLAKRAWQALNEDIQLGYSGSSGVNTPPSIKTMLARYKKLAMPTNKK